MIATKFVLALAVLVGQSLAVSVQGSPVEEALPKSQLEEICNGESEDTLNVDQVISIAAELEQDSSIRCSENVRQAFKSMHDMIADARENGCTRETVQAITKSFPSSQDFLETLPQVLSRFVIAYELSMSKHCKEVMTNTLLDNKQLKASDFDAMDKLLNSKLNAMLESVNDIDSYLLPGDLAALLPDDHMRLHEIEIEPATPEVEQLKALCTKRFKPVYKQVVEPVIELANAGIDYPDELFVEARSKEEIPKLNLWSRIVFLCETMEMVKLSEKKLIGENESELEELESEPVAQEGLKEIETFDDEELNELIEFMERDRMMDYMREAILMVARDLTENYIDDGELETLFVCVWPGRSEDGDDSSDYSSDSDLSESGSGSDSDLDSPRAAQQECGLPKSVEHAALATVLATVVMSALYPLAVGLGDMPQQD